MTFHTLKEAFERWRDTDQPLVLASVYETAGSTYSKAGAQMLINSEGDFQGMLSGGCLEGDLAERAGQVLRSGKPQAVTYDLGQNDEELWGLGVGCDGLMRIFLQTLHKDTAYEPFASMCRAYGGDSIEVAATVLESPVAQVPPGASLVTVAGKIAFSDIDRDLLKPIRQQTEGLIAAGRSRTKELNIAGGQFKLLLSVLRPPPRILLLGGGLDARPVLRLIAELGWRVILQDHRPAYIAAGKFGEAERVICVPAQHLGNEVNFACIDAVIVMSHHLATDRKYLEILAGTDVRYIALLGPAHRRERLLDELGGKGDALRNRIHGPAGIDIGASGPASIALSIVAQMHQVLCR